MPTRKTSYTHAHNSHLDQVTDEPDSIAKGKEVLVAMEALTSISHRERRQGLIAPAQERNLLTTDYSLLTTYYSLLAAYR